MWISDSKAATIQSSDLKSNVTYSFNTNELFTLSYRITFRPRASWNIQTNKLHSTSTHSINSWVGFWLHSVRETSLKAATVIYFPCVKGRSVIFFLGKVHCDKCLFLCSLGMFRTVHYRFFIEIWQGVWNLAAEDAIDQTI